MFVNHLLVARSKIPPSSLYCVGICNFLVSVDQSIALISTVPNLIAKKYRNYFTLGGGLYLSERLYVQSF